MKDTLKKGWTYRGGVYCYRGKPRYMCDGGGGGGGTSGTYTGKPTALGGTWGSTPASLAAGKISGWSGSSGGTLGYSPPAPIVSWGAPVSGFTGLGSTGFAPVGAGWGSYAAPPAPVASPYGGGPSRGFGFFPAGEPSAPLVGKVGVTPSFVGFPGGVGIPSGAAPVAGRGPSAPVAYPMPDLGGQPIVMTQGLGEEGLRGIGEAMQKGWAGVSQFGKNLFSIGKNLDWGGGIVEAQEPSAPVVFWDAPVVTPAGKAFFGIGTGEATPPPIAPPSLGEPSWKPSPGRGRIYEYTPDRATGISEDWTKYVESPASREAAEREMARMEATRRGEAVVFDTQAIQDKVQLLSDPVFFNQYTGNPTHVGSAFGFVGGSYFSPSVRDMIGQVPTGERGNAIWALLTDPKYRGFTTPEGQVSKGSVMAMSIPKQMWANTPFALGFNDPGMVRGWTSEQIESAKETFKQIGLTFGGNADLMGDVLGLPVSITRIATAFAKDWQGNILADDKGNPVWYGGAKLGFFSDAATLSTGGAKDVAEVVAKNTLNADSYKWGVNDKGQDWIQVFDKDGKVLREGTPEALVPYALKQSMKNVYDWYTAYDPQYAHLRGNEFEFYRAQVDSMQWDVLNKAWQTGNVDTVGLTWARAFPGTAFPKSAEEATQTRITAATDEGKNLQATARGNAINFYAGGLEHPTGLLTSYFFPKVSEAIPGAPWGTALGAAYGWGTPTGEGSWVAWQRAHGYPGAKDVSATMPKTVQEAQERAWAAAGLVKGAEGLWAKPEAVIPAYTGTAGKFGPPPSAAEKAKGGVIQLPTTPVVVGETIVTPKADALAPGKTATQTTEQGFTRTYTKQPDGMITWKGEDGKDYSVNPRTQEIYKGGKYQGSLKETGEWGVSVCGKGGTCSTDEGMNVEGNAYRQQFGKARAPAVPETPKPEVPAPAQVSLGQFAVTERTPTLLPANMSVGKLFTTYPDSTVVSVQTGEKSSISELVSKALSQGKHVVLSLGIPACGGCVGNSVAFGEFQSLYGDSVEFISVTGDNADRAKAVVDKYGITTTVWASDKPYFITPAAPLDPNRYSAPGSYKADVLMNYHQAPIVLHISPDGRVQAVDTLVLRKSDDPATNAQRIMDFVGIDVKPITSVLPGVSALPLDFMYAGPVPLGAPGVPSIYKPAVTEPFFGTVGEWPEAGAQEGVGMPSAVSPLAVGAKDKWFTPWDEAKKETVGSWFGGIGKGMGGVLGYEPGGEDVIGARLATTYGAGTVAAAEEAKYSLLADKPGLAPTAVDRTFAIQYDQNPTKVAFTSVKTLVEGKEVTTYKADFIGGAIPRTHSQEIFVGNKEVATLAKALEAGTIPNPEEYSYQAMMPKPPTERWWTPWREGEGETFGLALGKMGGAGAAKEKLASWKPIEEMQTVTVKKGEPIYVGDAKEYNALLNATGSIGEISSKYGVFDASGNMTDWKEGTPESVVNDFNSLVTDFNARSDALQALTTGKTGEIDAKIKAIEEKTAEARSFQAHTGTAGLIITTAFTPWVPALGSAFGATVGRIPIGKGLTVSTGLAKGAGWVTGKLPKPYYAKPGFELPGVKVPYPEIPAQQLSMFRQAGIRPATESIFDLPGGPGTWKYALSSKGYGTPVYQMEEYVPAVHAELFEGLMKGSALSKPSDAMKFLAQNIREHGHGWWVKGSPEKLTKAGWQVTEVPVEGGVQKIAYHPEFLYQSRTSLIDVMTGQKTPLMYHGRGAWALEPQTLPEVKATIDFNKEFITWMRGTQPVGVVTGPDAAGALRFPLGRTSVATAEPVPFTMPRIAGGPAPTGWQQFLVPRTTPTVPVTPIGGVVTAQFGSLPSLTPGLFGAPAVAALPSQITAPSPTPYRMPTPYPVRLPAAPPIEAPEIIPGWTFDPYSEEAAYPYWQRFNQPFGKPWEKPTIATAQTTRTLPLTMPTVATAPLTQPQLMTLPRFSTVPFTPTPTPPPPTPTIPIIPLIPPVFPMRLPIIPPVLPPELPGIAGAGMIPGKEKPSWLKKKGWILPGLVVHLPEPFSMKKISMPIAKRRVRPYGAEEAKPMASYVKEIGG